MALISVLFTQLAVAAYACPGLLSSSGSAAMLSTSDATPDPMPDCGQPDTKRPMLCHAHCQEGQQSVDKTQLPTIAPLIAVGFVLVLLSVPVVGRPLDLSPPSHLERATAPPLSIRNCCFRI